MKDCIKEFFEKHINLLDDGEFVKFFKVLYSDETLWDEEAAEVCFMLKHAGIPVDQHRKQAIEEILDNDIKAFSRSKDPSIYSMPVAEYVEIYIDNYLGMPEKYWADMIIQNKDNYTAVNIFEENGMWILSRKD